MSGETASAQGSQPFRNIEKNGRDTIFVAGPPRSGTTLVQNMLDSHPDILGLPEFKHLADMVRLRNDLLASTRAGMIDAICSPAEVDQAIRDLINGFLGKIRNQYPCRLISEKTPQNTMVLEELSELFPAAKFIFVVRDPRAIVSSLLKVERKAAGQGRSIGIGIRTAIRSTRKYLSLGFAAREKKPDKIHLVVYEDLVNYPERETKKICAFLGIDWAEGMLHPGCREHLSEGGMTCAANSIWYDEKTFRRDPDPGVADKWKNSLTPGQQVRITRAFQGDDHLKGLGYCFDLGHLSAGKRFLGAADVRFRTALGDLRLWLLRILNP